ncbi:thermostable hemolysin [Roseinatronobacter sp.]|uniref:thermostable hemolysin n=1 Tax=Roseinatronobacter sp. TaxID=1945755 RepID=UPI003F4DD5F9
MRIEFLSGDCPGRQEAQDHIRQVYRDVYGAEIKEFAPLLVSARRADGEVLCAAGIRTCRDRFFSDRYLEGDFSNVLRTKTGIYAPQEEIMEVVSLASVTPFPVLPMMDAMIRWGQANGMTCGVFTATQSLRRLLKRTGLAYVKLAEAEISKVGEPDLWGSYYETDPWVCAFNKAVTLSPRTHAVDLHSEAS